MPATWFDDDEAEALEAPGTDHVVVRLGGGRYGISAPAVAEVIAMPSLTRVPATAGWLCGVGNWRGHVLPVVDLRPLLGLAATPLPSSSRVVVVSVDDVEVGIVAEAVSGLVPVPDVIAPAPVTLTGSAAELVRGLVDDGPAGPVAVLDTAGVLALRGVAGRARTSAPLNRG
jgi:purine-binding chemotaxis protein CheW